MLDVLLSWWVVVPVSLIVAYHVLRFWAESWFAASVQEVLTEAQSAFANGNVEVYAIRPTGTKLIDGEEALYYDLDVTIRPSTNTTEWTPNDLFVWGVDEEGDGDPCRIGEVRSVRIEHAGQHVGIKRSTNFVGPQRLTLAVRMPGGPGPARFNYNFACFGPEFELPAGELAPA